MELSRSGSWRSYSSAMAKAGRWLCRFCIAAMSSGNRRHTVTTNSVVRSPPSLRSPTASATARWSATRRMPRWPRPCGRRSVLLAHSRSCRDSASLVTDVAAAAMPSSIRCSHRRTGHWPKHGPGGFDRDEVSAAPSAFRRVDRPAEAHEAGCVWRRPAGSHTPQTRPIVFDTLQRMPDRHRAFRPGLGEAGSW
jgi:hypothetical protein